MARLTDGEQEVEAEQRLDTEPSDEGRMWALEVMLRHVDMDLLIEAYGSQQAALAVLDQVEAELEELRSVRMAA